MEQLVQTLIGKYKLRASKQREESGSRKILLKDDMVCFRSSCLV